MATGIVVTGVGEVSAAPDILAVTFEVETHASTVAAAREANAAAAHLLLASLKDAGTAARDIQTRSLTVNAEYDHSGGKPRLMGYVVGNSVRATLTDLGRAGETIDAALAAAGDDARLSGLRFEFSEPAPLLTQARIRACLDAREKRTRSRRGWASSSASSSPSSKERARRRSRESH
jgi:uncharacterized protein YggE